MKIALVHFQPLEHYPPVMNCILDLEKEKGEDLCGSFHCFTGDLEQAKNIYITLLLRTINLNKK